MRPRLVLLCLALTVGALVRMLFLPSKPFWRDEAWVAWVAERPWPHLASASYAVPPGFLAAVKLLGALLPSVAPEVTYRLPPLAAGLVTMALLPLLARRLDASPPVVLASAWLGAGLPALVYYSRELKPHGVDALTATLIPLLVAGLADDLEGGRRRLLPWVLLLAVLAVLPWLSYGGLFPSAAAIGWALARSVRHRRAAIWIALGAILAAAAGGAYVFAVRRQLQNTFLRQLWSQQMEHYAGLSFPAALARALGDVHSAALTYLFPGVWPVAIALIVVGVVAWPGHRRALLLWMWIAPAVMASVATAAGLYVVSHGRLLLFLAPPFVLLAAAGLVRGGGWLLSRRGEWTAVAVAMAAGCAWSAQALYHRRPATRPDMSRYFLYDVIHDVEPLIRRLHDEHPPPGAVMASRLAADSFRYYSRGRFPGAYLVGLLDTRFGDSVGRWRRGLRGQGFLVLVEEEVEGGRREALQEMGFVVDEVARARGTRLWRLTDQRWSASPPRTP